MGMVTEKGPGCLGAFGLVSIYHCVYTQVVARAVAKVFKSGNSQAVRLPKSFRLSEGEVYIEQLGAALLLIPKEASAAQVWEAWYQGLGELEPGFKIRRNQPKKVDKRSW